MKGVLDFINSLEPSIQFTCELEVCSSIPFLDVVIDRNNDGKFSTKVSRKITHTNRYLDFKSNHPLQHKLSVVRSLRNRASYFSCPMSRVALNASPAFYVPTVFRLFTNL